ncbi:MAG: hemolysin III family protein [Paracoccaceae bacterium]|nr:hemolysin III family protein [Paracoccaceae bacterium]MDE3239861.1 hemolysin III family protein [Paracoccaceae bacterium]
MAQSKPRLNYSPAERRSDAAVHVAGVAFVAVAVPGLIWMTFHLGATRQTLIGVSIYGATLVAMILFSALYNTVGQRRWGGLLKRLDHSAIYAKIAGTYTPFILAPGAHGWLLTGLWSAALAGIGLKAISPQRMRWLGLALYLGMGWAGIAAGSAFFGHLSPEVIALILIGGGLYTLGVVFYLAERLPFHYTIWHVFVLVASVSFYAAVALHVVQTAPAA